MALPLFVQASVSQASAETLAIAPKGEAARRSPSSSATRGGDGGSR